MDVGIWGPIVRRVTAMHAFECQRILPGLAGTFPTFIAELNTLNGQNRRAIVIKFFGPLFDGAACHIVEKEMGSFISQHNLSLRSPSILAEGQLSNEWSYLIFEHIPGNSIGQMRHEISMRALEGVAEQMGTFIRELHSLTATAEPTLLMATPRMSWESYTDFLQNQQATCQQNHLNWHDLPAQLLHQIPGFIPPVNRLLDLSAPPHLIHADLTADHLLGQLIAAQASEEPDAQVTVPNGMLDPNLMDKGHGWKSLAVIDWGDCRLGNILYELVALHIDLFQADKHLLRICLQAYRLPVFYQTNFSRKALSTVLLHQFPMPASIYAPFREVQSLDELAEDLFGI
jgi:Phosphotransferase enzyme family